MVATDVVEVTIENAVAIEATRDTGADNGRAVDRLEERLDSLQERLERRERTVDDRLDRLEKRLRNRDDRSLRDFLPFPF